jgi:DNA polymerase-3 subunit gamma/tau
MLAIDPIFSSFPSASAVAPASETTSRPAAPAASSPVEKAPVVVKKRKDEIGSPSIMQALSGNFKGEEVHKTVVPEKYAQETRDTDHDFTEEQLLAIWPELIEKYAGQIHLCNTLKNKPQLLEHYKVQMTVENSVQLDQIRLIKPEIIGFLQRTLRNSKIDVKIEMNEAVFEDKLLTDEQKLAAMMKKNPALLKMKSMFNLDFNG